MRSPLLNRSALGLVLALVATAPAAAQRCAADVDGDGRVVVAELVLAVRHGLDGCPAPPRPCGGDADGDGVVDIAELVGAVVDALEGCPAAGSDLVVDAAWLAARLDEPGWQVIDARGLAAAEHIPGALPLTPSQLATRREGVDFQVVGPEAAGAVLGAIGLRRDAGVVVYGVPPEYDPARVVWALRHLGHPDVRYLDGGWAAWLAADGPRAAGAPQPAGSGDYTIAAVRDDLRVTGDWLLAQLGEPPDAGAAIQIVDARSPAEFAAGHIPTAVSAPWSDDLDAGRLRRRAALAARYAELGLDPQRTTVTYCLAGWRASVAWLVLTELGFADVRVYDGSWLEWGADVRFPIEP